MIIGLDMGGTHIDAVIIKDRKVIHSIKRLTNRDDLFISIWTTLKDLLEGFDKSKIKRINLSTTISTNAIVENKVLSVGMIIQAGPGLNSEPLACGDENKFVSGYVDHRGVEIRALDKVEIKKAKTLFLEKGIKACSVVGKFSTRNPNHELDIAKMLGSEFNTVTLGHRMSGKLNFPRRVFTSYLNSAVFSTFNDFSRNIKKSLEKEGIDTALYILKADGGTMDINLAEKMPVETILSGPAASFMGLSSLIASPEDAILLDIGGTTTDIFFLSQGSPLFEPLGAKISKYKTLVRAIYSFSIGLGGDSSIAVENSSLHIGPKRDGRPFAFGGPSPTPTDAMIYLDLMALPSGASKEKAKEALSVLSAQIKKSEKETAKLILSKMAKIIKTKTDELLLDINSKPIYTIDELLHVKLVTPKAIYIIGGPASILSRALKEEYSLPCHVPVNYAVANAIGAALAKPTFEISLLANTSLGTLAVPELGIYESVSKHYSLQDAKERASSLLREFSKKNNLDQKNTEIEITEESSFNMVRGFSTSGKNIRIKAQIKPGHIMNLVGDTL